MPGQAPAATAARGRAAGHGGTTALPVPLTSLVGRSADLDTVAGLLGRARLVTLVGAGGCGKTRLALAAASRERDAGTPVAWWPLAPLREAAFVAPSLATTLGLQHSRADAEALAGALGNREVLVVADNCEHLADEIAELLLALLPECPGLRVLATSRQALRVAGEHVWEVPPLGVPPEPATAAESVSAAPAVELFLDRAAAAGAALGPGDLAAVARLVRRLDGMPLAVELAAARTAVVAPAELDEQLDDAFRVLVDDRQGVPARQRTLHATLAWSHDLLDADERVLFRRLAVFAGPFDRDVAAAVAGDPGKDAGAVLDSLVRRYLVRSLPDPSRRGYRLLEPVRQYAAQRLAEAGELEETARRHAGAHLALARRLGAAVRGPAGPSAQREALDHLDARSPDLRAALSWARRTPGEEELLVDLVVVQWWAWWRLGRFPEGLTWTRAALATGAGTTADRAELLHALGWLARHQDDPYEARAALTEALGLYDDLGDDADASIVLHRLAAVCLDTAVLGEPECLAECRELVEASAARARAAGDDWTLGGATYWHGLLALAEHDPETAARLLTEARALFVVAGDRWAVGRATGMSAVALLRTGRLRDAAAALREAERTSEEVHDRWGVARWALHDAQWHLAAEQPEEAARSCARAATGFAELGDGLRVVEVARVCAAVLSALGRDAGAAELRAAVAVVAARRGAAGARLADQVVELAAAGPAPGALPEPLSARELEVLRLVARGCSDAEVARTLFLSKRTVGGHLGSAYRKLGVRSRTAAARRMAELGLARADG
ncbi:ATP-binding protein [Geodermatophilus sp. CPCC 205761]|uniref:ATP-binding protein n=1 Tax=Geodermatophilus sp. CPCC 205761 TaxID=2936597 RepID=UPI003EEA1512